jgi:hypothetical protein
MTNIINASSAAFPAHSRFASDADVDICVTFTDGNNSIDWWITAGGGNNIPITIPNGDVSIKDIMSNDMIPDWTKDVIKSWGD